MSRPPHTSNTLLTELTRYHAELDVGTRKCLGLSGVVYRALDRLFNILVLMVTVYLVQYAKVEPMIAMFFAVLLIGGAEYLQTFMIASGQRQSNKND